MRSRTRVSGGPAPAEPEAVHVRCSFKAIRYSRLAIPDGSARVINRIARLLDFRGETASYNTSKKGEGKED